ncbi:TPA: hypothetical protein DCZ46_02885 [Candidatus Campbellbacteria bacterium]|nr:MAG: protein of unknown function with transmembrane region [Candidatus Campbellbacteria bacterium GW2011_OD1_34_28]KKP74928.1 MAG: hypothetical protein UR74_C0002G0194 [Candidatus Campbellbacteria bacterium GW2011_GWD2_35_24]KKP75814.1 MAG: hypothetical protein UR75_C0002G0195 [Candidatus Campbellbacteria bacterium GW2011_GWC2_35_28]KKP76938.1 MAG: hypothetical protein UR76_C0002G0139 [Candidatus Campbellbacteria bacterium GW2011_GWC1_35_31]KKP78864.1 MAG: hypothetical protein UR79_C0002G013
MTNFQIVLTGIFVFFIMVGVVLFATFGKGGSSDSVGSVAIWGTLDKDLMNQVLDKLKSESDNIYDGVTYRQIDEENFNQELAEAISSGKGPDVFMLPQDSIVKHEDKIFAVPYDTYSVRNFKDKFIEEGELYLTNSGILAFPFTIDPMVMYWNRDIFSKNGIAIAPKYWDEFFALSQKVTDKDKDFNIFTSLVALGDYQNISHAKEIISTLLMQTGNPITKRTDDSFDVTLSQTAGNEISPTEEALSFYTQFSNPVKPVYTWNRALPDSTKSFLAGDLALYFGFASELSQLRTKNPNLNFDVAMMPQTESGNVVTFGKMYGLAVVKASKNIGHSYSTIQALTNDDVLIHLSELTNLPPVSRALSSKEVADPYLDIFYKSALISKGWLDLNKDETSEIFNAMINSIISGRKKISEAIQQAEDEMIALITR